MKIKEFIKPTLWKIILTLVLLIIWIICLRSLGPLVLCKCSAPLSGLYNTCTDYYNYLILRGLNCHCGCTPISELITNYFWYGLIPLIITYLLSCLIFCPIKKHKKLK